MSYSKQLISVGSDNFETSNVLELYDDDEKKWTRALDLNLNRVLYMAELIDNKLMIIGGSTNVENNTVVTTVDSFDLSTGILSSAAPLQAPRHYSSTAIVGEGKAAFLYVFGGWGTDDAVLNTVERWDPMSRVWVYVTPMPAGRTGSAAATIDHRIYIVGGRTAPSGYLDTMIAYNTKHDIWENKAPIKYTNAYFRITAHKDYLYMVGGNTASGVSTNRVERYNSVDDTWTTLANISSSGVVGVGILTDKVVCAGGVSSKIVELYDEEEDKWNGLPSLNVARNRSYVLTIPYPMKFNWNKI